MSHNHQFIQFEDKIVRRYAKTINSPLSGYRLDPNRPENRIDWLLASPNKLFEVIWEDGEAPKIIKKGFSYDDEVIELYSDQEVRLFERFNKAAIESGALKLYDNSAPAIDTTNFMSDAEIDAVATTKQVLAIRKKLSIVTSIQTLQRILDAVERHDRPMSIARAVQERMHELTDNNNKSGTRNS